MGFFIVRYQIPMLSSYLHSASEKLGQQTTTALGQSWWTVSKRSRKVWQDPTQRGRKSSHLIHKASPLKHTFTHTTEAMITFRFYNNLMIESV